MDHAVIVPVNISTVLIKWLRLFFSSQTLTDILTMGVLRAVCQNTQRHLSWDGVGYRSVDYVMTFTGCNP